MSNLEDRITRLEANLLKGQATEHEPDISTDSIIRKLGLDPDKVRVTAKENNQSIAEVTAGELGMPFQDFQKALRLRARGEQPTLP